jgi:nucleoid-associated protein YgaU
MNRSTVLKLLLIAVAGGSAVIPIQRISAHRAAKAAAASAPARARPVETPAPAASESPAKSVAGPTDGLAEPVPAAATKAPPRPSPDVPPAAGRSVTPDATAGAAPKSPPPAPPAGSPQPTRRTYVVKEGDSLWLIAERELGGGKWMNKILEANRGLDPATLKAGQTILLPERNGR